MAALTAQLAAFNGTYWRLKFALAIRLSVTKKETHQMSCAWHRLAAGARSAWRPISTAAAHVWLIAGDRRGNDSILIFLVISMKAHRREKCLTAPNNRFREREFVLAR